MVRDVPSEMLDDPCGHLVDLLIRVVEPGDEQRGDLEPYVGFVPYVFEGLENRGERACARSVIELFGEGLQIDVRRIHVREELDARLRTHVSGGDCDGADPPFTGRICDIDGIFVEDDGIVVGERDARRAEFIGHSRHLLGTRFVGEDVVLLRR